LGFFVFPLKEVSGNTEIPRNNFILTISNASSYTIGSTFLHYKVFLQASSKISTLTYLSLLCQSVIWGRSFYYLMVYLEFHCGEVSVLGGSYQQGWDDCSDAVLRIPDKIKRIEEA